MTTVTVCVGSSCHIKGSRQMIAQFDEMVKGNRLEDEVELRGSFCMERCGEGLNWQIGDLAISSQDVGQAVEEFTQRVLQPHTRGRTAATDAESGKG